MHRRSEQDGNVRSTATPLKSSVVVGRTPTPPPPAVVWYTTWVRVTSSARRHGITDAAIRHAVANAVRLVDTDDGLFIIGADPSGRLLELIARPDEVDDLVVFHTMLLRPVNAARYLP